MATIPDMGPLPLIFALMLVGILLGTGGASYFRKTKEPKEKSSRESIGKPGSVANISSQVADTKLKEYIIKEEMEKVKLLEAIAKRLNAIHEKGIAVLDPNYPDQPIIAVIAGMFRKIQELIKGEITKTKTLLNLEARRNKVLEFEKRVNEYNKKAEQLEHLLDENYAPYRKINFAAISAPKKVKTAVISFESHIMLLDKKIEELRSRNHALLNEEQAIEDIEEHLVEHEEQLEKTFIKLQNEAIEKIDAVIKLMLHPNIVPMEVLIKACKEAGEFTLKPMLFIRQALEDQEKEIKEMDAADKMYKQIFKNQTEIEDLWEQKKKTMVVLKKLAKDKLGIDI